MHPGDLLPAHEKKYSGPEGSIRRKPAVREASPAWAAIFPVLRVIQQHRQKLLFLHTLSVE